MTSKKTASFTKLGPELGAGNSGTSRPTLMELQEPSTLLYRRRRLTQADYPVLLEEVIAPN